MGGASAVMAPLAMAAFMAAGAQHQGGVNTMLGASTSFSTPCRVRGGFFSR